MPRGKKYGAEAIIGKLRKAEDSSRTETVISENYKRLERLYSDMMRKEGLADLSLDPEQLQQSRRSMEAAGWPDLSSLVGEFVHGSGTFCGIYNPMLKTIRDDVEADIKLRGAKLPGDVFVGALPIDDANASVQKTPHGYLVLVNTELLQLLYQIGKIFVMSLDLMFVDLQDGAGTVSAAERLGLEASNWTKERTIEAVAAVFRSHLQERTVRSAPLQELPQGARASFLANLVDYAERFVVAHEYGHILLGHCDDPEVMNDLHDSINYEQRRNNELRADELATSLLLASADMSDAAPTGMQNANLRIAGVMLFFVCFVIRDTCQHLKSFGAEAHEHATHPTPHQRLLRLRQFLCNKYGSSILNFGDHLVLNWAMGVVFPVVGDILDIQELKDFAAGCVVMSDNSTPHLDSSEAPRNR